MTPARGRRLVAWACVLVLLAAVAMPVGAPPAILLAVAVIIDAAVATRLPPVEAKAAPSLATAVPLPARAPPLA